MRAALLLAAALGSLLAAPLHAQPAEPGAVAPQAAPRPARDGGAKSAPAKRRVAKPSPNKPLPGKPAAPVAARAPLRPVAEDHPGFTRLVMPTPDRGSYSFTRDGDTFVVVDPQGRRLADPARVPRNVASVAAGSGTAEITVLPGVQVRTSRVGKTLAFDFLDPPRRPGTPAGSEAPDAAPAPVRAEVLPDAPAGASPSASASVPANTPARPNAASPPTVVAAPAAAAAAARGVAIEPVLDAAEATILLRAERDVGAAAFRVGGDVLVVLDAAIDFQVPGSTLDPAFAQMTARRTQDATVLRLPLPLPGTARLERDARGWLVVAGPPRSPVAGIVPRLVETGPGVLSVRLVVSEPSRVVTVMDPGTGGRLLVGTQGAAGEAVPAMRPQTQFSLLPTLQGIAVAATFDDIRLRREGNGFTLFAGPLPGGTIVADLERQRPGGADALPQSRLFDIPAGTTASLTGLLQERTRLAATSPALARSAPRLRVAETMLALGMGVEAQSVLDVAAADDPALRDSPHMIGLQAVAALLSHRLGAAGALADPRLTGTVEIELWRSLLSAARNQATALDGLGLATALPLLLSYPPTLRDRLLPDAVETMALNGQPDMARTALKALPESAELDLARGIVLEQAGRASDALKVYEQVANRSDRLPRSKAIVRAVELRIAAGELDAKAGADALDRALFAWRGAEQELPLRLRIANLRRQAGQWREAIAVLRDGRAAFPEDTALVDAEMASLLTSLFAGEAGQRLPASDFIALYDRNLDVIKDMPWSEAAGTRLVDHLAGLGLQGRAEPVMADLIARSTDPARRAALGARMASLRLTMNDPAGAIGALADTTPPAGAADQATMETRQLLYARAEAERGNKDAALAMLGALGTADADEARADIYASRKDWARAIPALVALERKQVRTADELTEAQQALVMRLAVAATHSADTATLRRLSTTYGAAMARGGSAAMFRLITSAPVQGTEDLPRAFEEIQLARRLQGPAEPRARP